MPAIWSHRLPGFLSWKSACCKTAVFSRFGQNSGRSIIAWPMSIWELRRRWIGVQSSALSLFCGPTFRLNPAGEKLYQITITGDECATCTFRLWISADNNSRNPQEGKHCRWSANTDFRRLLNTGFDYLMQVSDLTWNRRAFHCKTRKYSVIRKNGQKSSWDRHWGLLYRYHQRCSLLAGHTRPVVGPIDSDSLILMAIASWLFSYWPTIIPA